MKPYIIVGLAGGTGCGKTTIAQRLLDIGEDVVLLEQDAYYKDLSDLPMSQRINNNFDHPESLDFDLLIEHVKTLKEGNAVDCPTYDFSTHSRQAETKALAPSKIILVEGILIFAIKELRDLMDMKIFVDTDDDERLLRRIERDIQERGRTFESVRDQYLSTVKPMHLEFVEPTKRYADIIIPRGGENRVAINMVVAKLKRILKKGHMD
ncbi:uridine kinase [Algivirga pacifica]|uniref:Uridine kinase n=1 Tax=Algivirga pacifica TaxID=1162670 RepID=A0ABP9DAC7_9BACT